jgi:hypothetical protein
MTKSNQPSFLGLFENNGAAFVMNVNDAAEIQIEDASIVNEPLDATAEFKIVSISILDALDPKREVSPVPIPEPDELNALMVEFAIVSSLICEVYSSQ